MLTRRELMQAAAAAALTPLSGRAAEAPSFCLFSKHLPDLGWSDLGRAVKESGFDGVDLTVRAKGHVLPERAAADLPRAIDAIRSGQRIGSSSGRPQRSSSRSRSALWPTVW